MWGDSSRVTQPADIPLRATQSRIFGHLSLSGDLHSAQNKARLRDPASREPRTCSRQRPARIGVRRSARVGTRPVKLVSGKRLATGVQPPQPRSSDFLPWPTRRCGNSNRPTMKDSVWQTARRSREVHPSADRSDAMARLGSSRDEMVDLKVSRFLLSSSARAISRTSQPPRFGR